MEIFIIIVVLLIIWFFTSTTKFDDIKTAFKAVKKFEKGVHESLDVLEKKLDELNKDLEDLEIELEEKQRTREKEVYIAERRELAKNLSRLDENTEKYRLKNINTEWLVKDKLAKGCNSADSLEYINDYVKEVDDYMIDFLKIRFYLTGTISYLKLQCIDDYFKFKFPKLDERSYNLIWQNLADSIDFDNSKCKKIDAIYHFTHKSNLASILEYGVLTRTNLDKMNFEYTFNDQVRLDGVLDSISLSFSHPNFKMFYKYRRQTNDDNWVVLKISPSLLYGKEHSNSNKIKSFNVLKKVVFCKVNAASRSIRNITIEERMTCDAFLEMFESPIGRSLPTYTYDNQAEILYLGNIPVDFIEEIHTNYQDESLNWVRDLGYKVTENDIVFDKRRYRDG